jgi:hypothetical protein
MLEVHLHLEKAATLTDVGDQPCAVLHLSVFNPETSEVNVVSASATVEQPSKSKETHPELGIPATIPGREARWSNASLGILHGPTILPESSIIEVEIHTLRGTFEGKWIVKDGNLRRE